MKTKKPKMNLYIIYTNGNMISYLTGISAIFSNYKLTRKAIKISIEKKNKFTSYYLELPNYLYINQTIIPIGINDTNNNPLSL